MPALGGEPVEGPAERAPPVRDQRDAGDLRRTLRRLADGQAVGGQLDLRDVRVKGTDAPVDLLRAPGPAALQPGGQPF